jgi:hypothetical protein
VASNAASHTDQQAFRNNLMIAQKTFLEVYNAVKDKVDVSVK